MPLYINQDVIIVNNQKENNIFLFDRKSVKPVAGFRNIKTRKTKEMQ